MLSIHVKVGIAVYVCSFSHMEAGCGDRRIRGPCGPVGLQYATMNMRSCLKVEGEDGHYRLSSDLHTLASGASMLTYKCTQRDREKEGVERGR